MQPEKFSPKDSLQLIDSMINQAKNRVTENGFLYLLWGWVIFICAIFHFAALKLSLFKKPELVWMITWGIVIFQIIYLAKLKKNEKVKTYSDGIIDAIWICFGICMFVLVIVLGRFNLWIYINSLVLLLYGIPTFLSGFVMRFTPLKLGGICCWLLAIASTFTSPVYYLLMIALAVMIAWIIPGYLLRKKFKNQN
ncbi:MAG: hypothetical protein KA409_05010 [Ferruginibacter sp.]|nr:hypothetical protein [Chitinophagaceae bacterium]MBP6286258.1 hypothetical protein [Ferruginibacter sp.]